MPEEKIRAVVMDGRLYVNKETALPNGVEVELAVVCWSKKDVPRGQHFVEATPAGILIEDTCFDTQNEGAAEQPSPPQLQVIKSPKRRRCGKQRNRLRQKPDLKIVTVGEREEPTEAQKLEMLEEKYGPRFETLREALTYDSWNIHWWINRRPHGNEDP